jgi:DNA replication ATP-dependent helicase Dna2
MNSDILLLSNSLIYNDKLKCGSSEVANSFLDIPNISNFAAEVLNEEKALSNQNTVWLEQLLNPNVRVVFLDTDLVSELY